MKVLACLIGDHLIVGTELNHEVVERKQLPAFSPKASFGPGEMQQLLHHSIELSAFPLNSVQFRKQRGRRFAASQCKGSIQAAQRRTKFIRNLNQLIPLRRQESAYAG
jgi:hypothetical protein